MTSASGPPSRGSAACTGRHAMAATTRRKVIPVSRMKSRRCAFMEGLLSVELGELLGGFFRREGDERVVGVLLRGDDRLAFLGQREARVFLDERIERLSGGAHRVEPQVHCERIASGMDVLVDR